jgi:redox-sensing transcriptional repressor
MSSYKISNSVIRRLPRYYRFLAELLKLGLTRVSSNELSEKMGLTASQIRQDLNCFGGFGQQGYGYNIPELHEQIANILGLNKQYKAIMVGAGNLGKAIATHMNFKERGFNLVGIFDKNEEIVGNEISGVIVKKYDEIEEFCINNKPSVAILCVPKTSSKEIAQQLVKYGIIGFWNYSHFDLSVEFKDVVVENVHLSDSLMTLCYKINEKLKEEE